MGVPEDASGVLAHRSTNVSRWSGQKTPLGGTGKVQTQILALYLGTPVAGCWDVLFAPSAPLSTSPAPPEIPYQPSRHLVAPPSCKKCPQEHRSSPRPMAHIGVRRGHQFLHLRIAYEGTRVREWTMVVRTNLPALFGVSEVL